MSLWGSAIFELTTKSFLRGCFKWGTVSELIWAFDLQQAIRVWRMGIGDQSIRTRTQPSIFRIDDKPRRCNFDTRMSISLHRLQVGTDCFVFIVFPPSTQEKISRYVSWFVMEFTSENGEVLGRHLQTQPKNEAIILHWRSSYLKERSGCPLVLASIAIACPGVTLRSASGVTEAHGTTDDTGVLSSTCKLGGEARSIARGLQSFACINVTVTSFGETQALYIIDESVLPI